MSSAIILNKLPNVYINKVTVSEKNDKTVIIANVSLMDNLDPLNRKWFSLKSVNKIKINMSLVEGKDIKRIKSGAVRLKKKDAVSVLASNKVSQSRVGTHIKYDYNLKITLLRKVSSDSSLFFFTTLDLDRLRRRSTGSNSVGKKLNHGIYANSKKLKSPRNKDKTGGVKHLPIFVDGKKVTKLPVYKLKVSDQVWHGDVKFSIGRNKYMTNVPSMKSAELEKHSIDNNVVLYNMPIKPTKAKIKKKHHRIKAKHKKLPHIKKINSLYTKPFKYEMEEQVDPSGNIHKFFMLNLCNLALSKSRVAQKIYNTDKDLFMQIGESLSLGRIKIERSKFKSLAASKKNAKSKYKKNRRKFNTKKNHNRRIVAQLNLRKPMIKSGLFGLDDKLYKRKLSKPSANLELVDAGLGNDIKTLYFVDRTASKAGKGRLSYKVDIDFDDMYYIYVKTILRDMLLFKKELLNIKNTVVKSKAYNRTAGRIKGTFIEKYFSKYNMFAPNNKIKNNQAVEESPIVKGIVAVDTASLLLGMDAQELQVDSKVNFKNATPETLRATITDLDKIIYLLQKRYSILPTFNKVSGVGKGVKSRKANKSKIITKSFVLTMDKGVKKRHVMYQVMDFGNNLKMNKTSLESRANAEVSKYFSGAPTDKALFAGTFDNETRAKLLNISENKHQFFTSISVKSGKHERDTSNFDKKIDTKFFSVIKTIRKKALSNKKIKNIDFNVRSNIPVTITPEALTIEDEKRDNIISATKFLGKNSPFVNSTLLKKRLNRLKSKSSIEGASRNFVFENKNVKSLSIYDMNNGQTYQQIKDKKIDPLGIPLQIKSLILNKSPSVKANFLSSKDDIFKNPKTDEIAYQMYGNIFELKYIESFGLSGDGLVDMKKPIIKSMSGNNYGSLDGSNKICFLNRYTNKIILQKKDPFEVFGDVFLLVDRGQAQRAPSGRTTHNAKHHHGYNVDKNGNGYTTIAVHPDNPSIRHRHKVINWIVQEAKSSCYPRCKDKYGVEGAPPHAHHIMKRKSMSKIRSKDKVARRFMSNFNNESAQSTMSQTSPQTSPQTMTPTAPVGGTSNVY